MPRLRRADAEQRRRSCVPHFFRRNATPRWRSNFFPVQLPATGTAAASAATAGEWAIAEDAAAAWTPPEADAATAACGLSYKLTARFQGGGTYPSASPGAGAASECPFSTLLNCSRSSTTVLTFWGQAHLGFLEEPPRNSRCNSCSCWIPRGWRTQPRVCRRNCGPQSPQLRRLLPTVAKWTSMNSDSPPNLQIRSPAAHSHHWHQPLHDRTRLHKVAGNKRVGY
jgi:hypothetical protein